MLRRAGRFRSDMRQEVMEFVHLLYDAVEAETIQTIGCSSDAFQCVVCNSTVVECSDGPHLCIKCPLCSLGFHSHCLKQHAVSDQDILDVVARTCGSHEGAHTLKSLLDVISQVFCGPLAKLDQGPVDVLCVLCSKLVSQAVQISTDAAAIITS